jgi:putative ATPase
MEEFLGQPRLMGEGGVLRRLIMNRTFRSMVIYGPPGCGKSAFVHLSRKMLPYHFETVRAGEASGNDLRKSIDRGISYRQSGQECLLVIEEIDRFTRTQQDALVPALEREDIRLLGLSFDNPVKTLLPPLASRLLLFSFQPLSPENLSVLLERGRRFLERREGIPVRLSAEAVSFLVRRSGGDGRKLLITIDVLVSARKGEASGQEIVIDLAAVRRMDAVSGGVSLDRESHYNLISAFIKSVRNHDPDSAVHYLARMIDAGEDPVFIARRLVVLAAEDIGLANPLALTVSVACLEAVRSIGLPEARIVMAETALFLAMSPKSNSAYRAIDRALAEVRDGFLPPVPFFLRNVLPPSSVQSGMLQEREESYLYPPDTPTGVSLQSGLPEGHTVYFPPEHLSGEESEMVRRLRDWKRLKSDPGEKGE